MEAQKKNTKPKTELVTGHWLKRDAAQWIAQGARHLHSSALVDQDLCVATTKKALQSGIVPLYPWEPKQGVIQVQVDSSSDRHTLAEQLKKAAGVNMKRELGEKLTSVLEEMLTNAIYHSYRLKNGTEKYPRQEPVKLTDHEKVTIKFAANSDGFYLSVMDQGGSLQFQDIMRVFARVYKGEANSQMETKSGGAGLGIYLIFESATHVKIESTKNAQTNISCWISDKKTFDPKTFSFNYFERG